MRPTPRSPGTPTQWLRVGVATLLLISAWRSPIQGEASAVMQERDGLGAAGVPSIQYRDAAAHAADVVEFDPGGRVTTPFSPRAGDAWAIDGAAPRALPAGRTTGDELRAGANLDRSAAIGVPAAHLASFVVQRDAADGLRVEAPAWRHGLSREVFGFLPYWQLSDPDTVLDWRTLSTVAYFSVGCTSSGALAKRDVDGSLTTGWAGWTSAKMTSVIDAAHESHARVVLTVSCFGWSATGAANQADLLSSGSARARLARQIAAAIRDRGADGVNLDFEPIVPGYADAFVKLVRAVRAELDAIAPGYQLTFDAMGTVGSQPIAEATAPGGADAVLIMGYDYRTENAAVAGSIDPLAGPAYDLTDTVEAFTALVPPSKVILGVPYYGRAWSTPNGALHAPNISGARFGGAAEPTYVQAAALAEIHGRRWDPVEKAPWTAYRRKMCSDAGCVTTWRQTYFDDARSLTLRYDLVNRSNLRGVGIWALGYDGNRPELRAALAAAFSGDREGPDVGIAVLPSSVRGEAFRVAWVADDGSAIASYDVQVSIDGAQWRSWLKRTTATSATYGGEHGHAYAFRVRATDADGETSTWPSISLASLGRPAEIHGGSYGVVVVDGLRLRATPSTSAAVQLQFKAGDALRIIGDPVSAEGYAWFPVAGPVRQSGAVEGGEVQGWVAAFGNGYTHVEPRVPVYATWVE